MSTPETSPLPQELPPAVVMTQMITSRWVSQAIYVAAKLGIADLLQAGAKTSDELAALTATHAPSLYRVLRALASLGIFIADPEGRFHLTPLAQCLRSDAPDSMRGTAIMFGEDWHWQPWGNILTSVKTGRSAFEQTFGQEVFPYLTAHPEAGAIFNQAMTSFSATESTGIATAYDFGRITTLVDVAGGHGGLLSKILQAYPGLQGILFDLPEVIAGAQAPLAAAGLTERCRLEAGDFFTSVPTGGDAYLLKHILHDWDDQQAIAILKNCYQAMPQGGKVLVAEMVVVPDNQPSLAKLLDLEMLVMSHGGRERTEAEYQALFTAAGFRFNRVVPTSCPISVIEGIRDPEED